MVCPTWAVQMTPTLPILSREVLLKGEIASERDIGCRDGACRCGEDWNRDAARNRECRQYQQPREQIHFAAARQVNGPSRGKGSSFAGLSTVNEHAFLA
jgi:hypothetical protein